MEINFTPSQEKAFANILAFLEDKDAKVFILKGYAGTGKTTMMRFLIEEMNRRKENYSLLASTGRAAKILANATETEARTVHAEIYKFTDLNQDLESVVSSREENKMDSTGQLYLNFDLKPVERESLDSVYYYIVDEASMISDAIDKTSTQAKFGSGKLLTDLLKYDLCGKFIFVGDICQLPPVSQNISPALNAKYIESNFSVKVYESELSDVVRQSDNNDIAIASKKIRKLYYNPQPWTWAKFPLLGYKNIKVLDSQAELVACYIANVKKDGFNKSTLIGFSNKQCGLTTQILRPSFGHLSNTVEKGDLLLITQNNLISGLMNGDLVTVEEVIIQERKAGLTFLKVTVKELFTSRTFSQLMIAELLYSNQTNLNPSQQKELYIDYYYRMKEQKISQKSELFKKNMTTDPYLNALRAVFGYVLTCHKSQGGEWDTVYLDIPKSVSALPKPYVYQWIYTAMTRAKKDLYLVRDFWII